MESNSGRPAFPAFLEIAQGPAWQAEARGKGEAGSAEQPAPGHHRQDKGDGCENAGNDHEFLR